MKIFYLIFLCSIFKIGFANSEPSNINLQGQVPRIEFESTKFNFGDIYRGEHVSHSFPFQNTGNGVLVLNSLHAPCGCLNTKIFDQDGKTIKSVFKPNESGLVKVEFDTSQFSGFISRSITTETNIGSSSPTVSLYLNANVHEELYSNPALLYIGHMDKYTEKSFYINLYSNSRAKNNKNENSIDTSKDIADQIDKSKLASSYKSQILNESGNIEFYTAESLIPSIQATLVPNTKPQKVLVKINNNLPIGPLNTKLIIWNNSNFYKNFEIPIIGNVVGKVNASAKYVEFGVVTEAKSAQRVITYSSSAKNFAITSVKINLRKLSELKNLSDSEIFEIKKEKISNSSGKSDNNLVSYRLNFKLIYPKDSNISISGINVSGNFIVKTNDPDYKEISIPFFGILKKENEIK